MKVKVIVPFTSIIDGKSTSHRKGEILEIAEGIDWLKAGFVVPVVESGAEKAVLPEPEKRNSKKKKKDAQA